MHRFTRFRPRFARLHPRFVDSSDFLHFYRNRIVARFRLRFVRFPSRFVDSRGSILYSSIREHPHSVRRFARFIPIRSMMHCEVPPSIRPEVPLSIREVPRPRFVDLRCSVFHSARFCLRSVARFRPRFVARFRPRFARFRPRFVDSGCSVLHSARFRSRFVARLRPRFARFHSHAFRHHWELRHSWTKFAIEFHNRIRIFLFCRGRLLRSDPTSIFANGYWRVLASMYIYIYIYK